jgi:methyl-accepting chemotaxis protein
MLRHAAGKLFLKFLAFSLPIFLVLCAAGLTLFSRYETRTMANELSARIASRAEQVSTALGRYDPVQLGTLGQDLTNSLLGDGAVACAEVRINNDAPVVRAPTSSGCDNMQAPHRVDMPIGQTGGVLTVRFSTRQIEALATQNMWFAIFALMGGFVAAVIAGAIGFRQVIGVPLNRLREAIDEGRRTGEAVAVNHKANDELGLAIAAYNDLQVRYRTTRENLESEASLRQKEAKRRADAERLTARIAEFRRVIVSIADGLTARVDAIGSVSQKLDLAASGMSDEVRSVERESAQSVQSTASVVNATRHLMTMSEMIGQHAINTRMAGDAVRDAQTSVQQKVEGLARAVGKITELSDLIGRIASQTNLLALNATIEAARAGEAGRGFAVVANEVKTLALNTAAATVQIGDTVKAIETEVKAAVAATSGLEEASELIEDASFNIVQALDVQESEVKAIDNAASASARAADAVATGLKNFTQVASRTELAASEVAQASEAIEAANGELRLAVEEFLSELAA